MNIKKISITLITVLLILNIIYSPKAYADDDTAGGILDAGDAFLSAGDNPSTVIDENKLKTTSSTVYKILLTIAICVAIVIGAVLGLQFVLGSVAGKVKVQEALVPYIVGCVVVFGAFTIWGIAVNTGSDIVPEFSTTSDGYTTPAVTGHTCKYCGKSVTIPAMAYTSGAEKPIYCSNCKKYIGLGEVN